MSDYNIPMQGILKFFLNVKVFFDLEGFKGMMQVVRKLKCRKSEKTCGI